MTTHHVLPLRIPLDVCNMILDSAALALHAHWHSSLLERQKFFRNSALVSREWLPRARFHLYSDVYLYSQDSYRRFICTIMDSDELASLVQELSPSTAHTYWTSMSTEDMVALFPLDVIKRLGNLRGLHFFCPWSPLGPFNTFITTFAACATLQTLELSHIRSYTFRDLASIVISFPNIKRLFISRCLWARAGKVMRREEFKGRLKALVEVQVLRQCSSMHYDIADESSSYCN